jgi:hypothetical protein
VIASAQRKVRLNRILIINNHSDQQAAGGHFQRVISESEDSHRKEKEAAVGL